ncbi:hypothetical protein ACEZ3G_10490 [Maribacter algicola]|uniref:Uncharacterized protein n=1 Tax=Meishania litoralis TaxID=3434685 RepID=A0ACC7LKZ3_9FLAO
MIFFCSILLAGCHEESVTIEQVDYESERPVGITFSTNMDIEKLRVFVGEESQTSVIGVIVGDKGKHHFAPVVPFTEGLTYTFRKNNTEVMASFTIPKRENTGGAELIAIHPKVDTVPENLLKMYFEFAQPMQEVQNALDFISVVNETDGIEIKPFLRLESELWNKERTVLTLWLDPGRIKTDLIPNKEKGLPLTAGKRYTMAIDSSWKSIQGTPLLKKYTKKFYVGPRDDTMPKTKEWQLCMQIEDSVKILLMDFGEPMDAFLAKETIRVYNTGDRQIQGKFNLLENESVLRFVPDEEWSTPKIEVRIESRLEDLAGNNLNRLFDTEVKKDPNQRTPKAVFRIPFEVR